MERCGEEVVEWIKQEGREKKGKKVQEGKDRKKNRKIRGDRVEKKKRWVANLLRPLMFLCKLINSKSNRIAAIISLIY